MNSGEAVPIGRTERWRLALLGWLAANLIRSLRRTLRLRFHDASEVRGFEAGDRRFILAFWHRHLLLMPYAYRGRRISVMISRSRDGELIAATVSRFGIDATRGSSSRGAVGAMRELLRKARGGFDVAFTPDGPRGPASRVQPGVLMAAAATGWPIVPVALAASRAWRLPSWDRFVVPKPLAAVHFVFGASLSVERDSDLAAPALELAERLECAERLAERHARPAAGQEATDA